MPVDLYPYTSYRLAAFVEPTLNISETVRAMGLVPKEWTINRKWPTGNQMVTRPQGQTCDPNALKAQYLENSWRCYLVLATIVYYIVCCEAGRSAILATDWLFLVLLRMHFKI